MAILYRRLFPTAEIHCFEPILESFIRLTQAAADDAGIVVNQLAVSDVTGPVQLYVNRFGATNSRLRPSVSAGEFVPSELLDTVGTERADSTTIDDYCLEHGLDRVDILKLDIQGGELEALLGADRMLAGHRIALVYTELLVAPIYEGQGRAGDVLGALEQHDYRLYGLYNLVYGHNSSLYQMDALFVSPELEVRG